MNITNLVFQLERVKHKLSAIYNIVRFKMYGVKYGRHFCVHGHPGIYVGKKANVSIGEGFYMSNGEHLNPLACNLQGNIHVNDGAQLIIGDNVGMSSVSIWCHKSIRIGDRVRIGANSIILDSDCHSKDYRERIRFSSDREGKKDAPIDIDDDVLIGMNCVILKGVKIGARAIIGAGSVVTKDIPADCIAAGNPAEFLRSNKID